MKARHTVLGLSAAASLSLVLASIALASPAGNEYLPQVPGSGASSGASQPTGTTTLPGSKDQSARAAVPTSNGSGSDGSDGSILLNPLVLLMVAAVIAAATGMILRRRQADEDEPRPNRAVRAPGSEGPRTPDGEIVAGRDEAA